MKQTAWADLTEWGRLFHSLGATASKAPSPLVLKSERQSTSSYVHLLYTVCGYKINIEVILEPFMAVAIVATPCYYNLIPWPKNNFSPHTNVKKDSVYHSSVFHLVCWHLESIDELYDFAESQQEVS